MHRKRKKQFKASRRNTMAEKIVGTGQLGFPQYPSEVDILLEIMDKNMDLLDYTCASSDLRGRDRACCNGALRCFDDIKTTVDEIDSTQNDFQILSACRLISSDLRKDKLCVKRSLSRCNGPGRVIMRRRFDTKISNLYNHFYKHCDRTPQTITSTAASPTTPAIRPPIATRLPPIFSPHTTHAEYVHPVDRPAASSATSTAIIAGAISGGVILLAVIVVAMVLWCRSMMKRDAYSNGSSGTTSGGSVGIFFQRRPNVFSTDRPQPAVTDKKAAKRQESSVYAEIDESFIHSEYQPEVTPRPDNMTNIGYIHPIDIGDRVPGRQPPPPLTPPFATSTLNQPGTSGHVAPFPMTRGQLTYGPILAANANRQQLFYQSNEILTPQMMNDYELPSQNTETVLSPADLQKVKPTSADNIDSSGNDPDFDDEYEKPVSVHSSNYYSKLDDNDKDFPNELAPDVPKRSSKEPELPKKAPIVPKLPDNYSAPMKPRQRPKPLGVSVLPPKPEALRPGSPVIASQLPPVSQPAAKVVSPVAKPRLTRLINNKQDYSGSSPVSNNDAGTQSLDKNNVLSARDSSSSTQSSHHYFVLEPETNA